MESKIDYITLTLKSKIYSLDDTLSMLSTSMLFGDLMKKMTCKGRAGYYDYRLTYENVEFFFTDSDRYADQGICIKLSSQGLDYFNKYLASYGLTLKEWLRKWRALVFDDYISKCTRFDYAMDDIATVDGCPTITMSHIYRAINNNEVCKKARTIDILCGAEISARDRIKYCSGKPLRGRTIYVGVRQSGKVVRFYDKLAEQLQQKKPVPKDVTHWTRCELELHDASAMGAFNAFLDCDDDQFAEYMRGVMNNHCRFITRNNDNISRCPSKRWWRDFLCGCTNRFKLPHKNPARSALARAERGLCQYVRTIYTLFQELGFEGVYRFFESEVNRLKAEGKAVYKPELAENLREDIRDYEEMSAFKHYSYNSEYDENSFSYRIRSQQAYYMYKFGRAYSNKFSEIHSVFMDGQEVLLDGL